MLDGLLSLAGNLIDNPDGTKENPDGFPTLAEMAVYGLYNIQESIIRLEHFLSHSPPNAVSNQERVEKYKTEHKKTRAKLVKQFGKETFDTLYAKIRATNNECARNNLDNSDGTLYSYVIPEFNSDGTHGPIGPKDIPWNTKSE